MRRLKADGKGFDAITGILDETGIKAKRAEKWARATVRQILKRAA